MAQVGDKFGKLTIISEVSLKTNSGDKVWTCQCECGNMTKVPTYQLNRKQTVSCGCYRYSKEVTEKRKQSMLKNKNIKRLGKNNSFLKLYKETKRQAKYRGLTFSLSLQQFTKLVQEPCYFCGKIGDKQYNPVAHKEQNSYTKTLTIHCNGIDRLNPSFGYSSKNCVSCCTEHNYMKRDLDEKEFLISIEKIYNYRIRGK